MSGEPNRAIGYGLSSLCSRSNPFSSIPNETGLQPFPLPISFRLLPVSFGRSNLIREVGKCANTKVSLDDVGRSQKESVGSNDTTVSRELQR